MEHVHLPGTRGRLRKRCRYIVADMGYDSDPLRRYCDRHRTKPIIARHKMQRKPRPGAPRGFDKPRYRERNIIERCFGWIKELRRVCTRYDKLASSFKAMVCLACIDRCLRANFSDRPSDVSSRLVVSSLDHQVNSGYVRNVSDSPPSPAQRTVVRYPGYCTGHEKGG